jgi:hypothetical protein
MRNFYTAACAHYSRRRGVPFFFHVAHEHDLDASVLSGRRMSVKLPFELLDATAGYWGLRRSPNVFVQTRRQEQLLSTRFDRRPLAVVGNFQELPAWLPEKDDNSTRVLWTANFKAFKRPEIYVEIAAAFIDRPEIDFVMVGKPHGHRRFQPLMQRIRSLPNLNFLGAMPFEETNREFSRSHIFVNTSEREGFPNTFIQAWSRGAVVVSLDVDVDDGMESLGIGYCTHSVERLVATIDMLVRDRVKRSDVAARAFAHVNQYHSMSSAVDLADRMLRAAQEHRSAVI